MSTLAKLSFGIRPPGKARRPNNRRLSRVARGLISFAPATPFYPVVNCWLLAAICSTVKAWIKHACTMPLPIPGPHSADE